MAATTLHTVSRTMSGWEERGVVLTADTAVPQSTDKAPQL
jgi:hypothetical protein